MNPRTLKFIAVVAGLLVAVLLLMERIDSSGTTAGGVPFIADLKDQLNDVRELAVTVDGSDESVTVVKNGDAWVASNRAGFPADVGKIREFLLAIADAKTVEQKTSNPERYGQLGVGDNGTRISIEGDDFTHELIIGNTAQTNFRYARLATEEQSWLIDKNPDLPENSGSWLQSDIIDIATGLVTAVSIEHPDGETIRIHKANAADANYEVLEIPDGRELSYPTVANGIAGALSNLSLEDVRQGMLADDAVLTSIEAFDGLQIDVRSESSDGEIWIALSASADGDAAAEAATINDSVAGWQYRIPEYKANLLRRRWADILKTESEE